MASWLLSIRELFLEILQIYVIFAVVANLTTGKFAKDGHFTCIAIKKEYNVNRIIKKSPSLTLLLFGWRIYHLFIMFRLTCFYAFGYFLYFTVFMPLAAII